MPEVIRVEGLRECEQALRELADELDLSNATAKNTISRALVEAAEPVITDAQAKAPVLTGTLQTSIDAGTRLSRRQKAETSKQSTVEVYIGPASLAQATAQEFGTFNNPAQPYMRPAWDGNQMKVLERIKDALWNQIEKTRQRAVRKAARVAAKIKAGI